MVMGRVWPANRGRESSTDRALDGQRLKLVCGVDGCKKSFTGVFVKVIAKRDRHRAEVHPDFVAKPTSKRTPGRFVRGAR